MRYARQPSADTVSRIFPGDQPLAFCTNALSNSVLDFLNRPSTVPPMENTIATITPETAAANNAYSTAVAPFSSAKKLRNFRFIALIDQSSLKRMRNLARTPNRKMSLHTKITTKFTFWEKIFPNRLFMPPQHSPLIRRRPAALRQRGLAAYALPAEAKECRCPFPGRFREGRD